MEQQNGPAQPRVIMYVSATLRGGELSAVGGNLVDEKKKGVDEKWWRRGGTRLNQGPNIIWIKSETIK